jgi:hypothetical protein
MQGVDGSTNVFVKKGDVDIQVEYSMSQNKSSRIQEAIEIYLCLVHRVLKNP